MVLTPFNNYKKPKRYPENGTHEKNWCHLPRSFNYFFYFPLHLLEKKTKSSQPNGRENFWKKILKMEFLQWIKPPSWSNSSTSCPHKFLNDFEEAENICASKSPKTIYYYPSADDDVSMNPLESIWVTFLFFVFVSS